MSGIYASSSPASILKHAWDQIHSATDFPDKVDIGFRGAIGGFLAESMCNAFLMLAKAVYSGQVAMEYSDGSLTFHVPEKKEDMSDLKIPIVIQKSHTLRGAGHMPRKAHYNDAGYDISSSERVTIWPGETVGVPTGIWVAVPDGWELQIRPRSGMSLRTGLRIANSPATIDSGFRGEVLVIMHNTGEKPYTIEPGDRIGQFVPAPVYDAEFIEVTEIPQAGDRGGGWGSTGK